MKKPVCKSTRASEGQKEAHASIERTGGWEVFNVLKFVLCIRAEGLDALAHVIFLFDVEHPRLRLKS